MSCTHKPVGIAKIIIMSSPPEITVALLDLDGLYKWRDVIYRKIEILLEDSSINTELLREWRQFYFIIAFEIMHRVERTGPYSDS